MNQTNYSLLKYLDSPTRVLSFSLNEFLLYCGAFFIGVFCDSLIVIPGLGMFTIYTTKKAFKYLPKFYLMRLLYWKIPTRRYNRLLQTAFPFSNYRLWVK